MENFHFKKKFGQNFLRNPQVLCKIANVIDYKPDALVVEVGPGAGALTRELAKKVEQVLCYEIDTELEDVLAKAMNDYTNVQILFDDFLKRDIESDILSKKFTHLYFVSNVPYYITTPILFKLLESHLPFEEIVMMVQKEVGERFSAKPGKKEYGALTVLLNYYFDIRKCFIVGRREFTPIPNVDSIVVSFRRKESLLPLKSEKTFQQLVHDSFRYKRKNLRNNLKGYPLESIEGILKKYGFSLTTRAEQLPYEIFVEMSNILG